MHYVMANDLVVVDICSCRAGVLATVSSGLCSGVERVRCYNSGTSPCC